MRTFLHALTLILIASSCGKVPAQTQTAQVVGKVSAHCLCEQSTLGSSGGGYCGSKDVEHETCDKLQAAILAQCPKSDPGTNRGWTISDHASCPYLYN